jgi:hypothetical protein
MYRLKDISAKTIVDKVALTIVLAFLLLVLHMVARSILSVFENSLYDFFVGDSDIWGVRGIEFGFAAFIMQVYESLAVSLVGSVLVVRHGWWNKKLLKHIAVWYAVYLAISFAVIIYEGKDWGILWDATLIFFTVENSLLPLIVIALYASMVAIIQLFLNKICGKGLNKE